MTPLNEKCETCKFYFEEKIFDQNTLRTLKGVCRRYPQEVRKNRSQWCGEWLLASSTLKVSKSSLGE